MSDVRLVDLEIIKRFSLAVRQEHADAEELLVALTKSRDQVLAAMQSDSVSRRKASPLQRRIVAVRTPREVRDARVERETPAKSAVRKSAVRKSAVRKSAVRKSAVRKTGAPVRKSAATTRTRRSK